MKKLYINTGGIDAVFNDLKDSFSGKLTAENNDYSLDIKSRWTKGSIKGTRFDDKIVFMHFDLVFHLDVSLSIESFHSAPVFFVYCESGNITHTFGVSGEKKSLKKSQTAILSNSSVVNSVLYFESHKRIQFTLLGMPTTQTAQNKNTELAAEVKKRFTNDSGNYIYVGKENSRISEKLQEYKTVAQKGITATLTKKTILKNIMEMELAQHSYNYLKTFDPVMVFTQKQINEIKKITQMSFSEFASAAGLATRNLPKLFKTKYHLPFKLYNQKLAS
ncbi:hypothetical protein [Flavobacterium branchiicola]|uniref:HTH araC/xylS-type domain-containing protein n=1 Tax=Flavobacterium branchiicola TaxID=1114875 RepID=A0ABV9PBI5_9FLAO|nr:hypothetical protein [Flavobacterium branchiicola]MBS7253540.1 hypothetical protein [Flavobacterium branchiicola]